MTVGHVAHSVALKASGLSEIPEVICSDIFRISDFGANSLLGTRFSHAKILKLTGFIVPSDRSVAFLSFSITGYCCSTSL